MPTTVWLKFRLWGRFGRVTVGSVTKNWESFPSSPALAMATIPGLANV
jgi:hypothetical protein